MADFGWSASCIVEAIKTANKIRKALQESGGAKENYMATVAFLGQIDATFKHLEKHVREHPDSPYRDAIGQQLKLIESPWKRVEASYVDKYEKSLGKDSKRSKLKQAPRMMQWAMKDIDGVVRKEKAGILEPLTMIGSLLSLGLMREVQELNEKCQKIIDELEVANLSSIVEKSLREIEETAHTKQLERITELQRAIEQHHDEMVDLMRSLSTGTTSYARQQNESTNSLSNGTTETTSIVMRVEQKLRDPIASLEAIKSELGVQKHSLDMMQITLHELAAKRSLGEPRKNRTRTPSAWITAGTMLATVASAFVRGYPATRSRPLDQTTTLDVISRQAVKQSSNKAPSDQHYKPGAVARARVVQALPSNYENRTEHWINEFKEKECNKLTLSSQKAFIHLSPNGPHRSPKKSHSSPRKNSQAPCQDSPVESNEPSESPCHKPTPITASISSTSPRGGGCGFFGDRCWYCCSCCKGPYSVLLHSLCECGHQRCSMCAQSKL